jgi:hypothetical protein
MYSKKRPRSTKQLIAIDCCLTILQVMCIMCHVVNLLRPQFVFKRAERSGEDVSTSTDQEMSSVSNTICAYAQESCPMTCCYHLYWVHSHSTLSYSTLLEMLNPFRSYVGRRPTVWFSSFAPMSEDVRHGFCCVCSPAVGACPTLFFM